MDLTQVIALSMGVAWASGLNLYAAILMLGLMGATGHIDLPSGLEPLTHPVVIAAAAFMYCVEFFADKMPGVDTGWDTLHTFIRIPAGAVLAASAIGDVSMSAQIAAALVGGSLTASVHATKAGGRVMINTSPEPVTNWTASVAEDVAVFGGLWVALHYPVLFLVLLFVCLCAIAWLLPKIWRGVHRVGRAVGRWLGLGADAPPTVTEPESSPGSLPEP